MSVRTQYMPLVNAILEATGQTVHLSTALRWCINGRAGCRLESWMIGGRRMTTVSAVERFIAGTTAADFAVRTPFTDERAQSSVGTQLDKELA